MTRCASHSPIKFPGTCSSESAFEFAVQMQLLLGKFDSPSCFLIYKSVEEAKKVDTKVP